MFIAAQTDRNGKEFLQVWKWFSGRILSSATGILSSAVHTFCNVDALDILYEMKDLTILKDWVCPLDFGIINCSWFAFHHNFLIYYKK